MKVRFITYDGIMVWDFCDFCRSTEGKKAKFSILHNNQKLVRKLCAKDARYLNESGTDKDFENLKRG